MAHSASSLSFPFVIGSGRSGTTLLRAMLDSHPDMAVPPESFFITMLAEHRPRYEASDRFDAEAFVADLAEQYWFIPWDIPADDVRAYLRERPPRTYADALRSVFAVYARRHGKGRYADKTPHYTHHLPTIIDLFGEAVFIHVLRDGRDVALSFLDMRFRPNGIAEAALLWKERVQAARSAGEQLGPDRYLELRYEWFVERPEEALREVCDFISLDYDPAMLSYWTRAEEIVAPDGGAERHPGIFQPPSQEMRNWREQMPQAYLAAFEAIAGDLLEEVGYERGLPDPAAAGDQAITVLIDEVERLRLEVVDLEWDVRRKLSTSRKSLRKMRDKRDEALRALRVERERTRHAREKLSAARTELKPQTLGALVRRVARR